MRTGDVGGEAMAKPEDSLREELLEARAKIVRQIEICEANPVSNGYLAVAGEAPAPTPVADLMATLKEIDDNLAGLDRDASPDAGERSAVTSPEEANSRKPFSLRFKRADIPGLLFLAAIGILALYLHFTLSNAHRWQPASGFGPEWQCTQSGTAGPDFCIKKSLLHRAERR